MAALVVVGNPSTARTGRSGLPGNDQERAVRAAPNVLKHY